MKDFVAIDLSINLKFCIYLASIQTTKCHDGSYQVLILHHAPTELVVGTGWPLVLLLTLQPVDHYSFG